MATTSPRKADSPSAGASPSGSPSLSPSPSARFSWPLPSTDRILNDEVEDDLSTAFTNVYGRILVRNDAERSPTIPSRSSFVTQAAS